MSFITGYRPAQVGEVTPYEMPIEDMATGVKIRQKRADDARNAMLSGDSALAIETRANQEDWDLAQEVRDEYKQNIFYSFCPICLRMRTIKELCAPEWFYHGYELSNYD